MKKNIVIALLLICGILIFSSCVYTKCAAYGHYSDNFVPTTEEVEK